VCVGHEAVDHHGASGRRLSAGLGKSVCLQAQPAASQEKVFTLKSGHSQLLAFILRSP